MGVRERYEKSKNANLTDKTEEKSVNGVKARFKEKEEKRTLESTIGFDTLESDLSNLGSTIGNVYNGWQTQETMLNTKKAVESMHKRLSDYQTYQSKYGGNDMSDLLSGYQSVLDDWDSLTSMYGQYKDADSFTNERTKLSELYSMSKEELESKLGSDNPYAYTTVGGQDITWQELYEDKFRKDMATSKEGAKGWEKYLADENKALEEAKEKEQNEKWYEKLGRYMGNTSDTTMISATMSQVVSDKRKDDSYMKPTDDWTEEERNVFGAYYLDDPKKAYDYATKLNNSKAKGAKNAQSQKIADSATSGFFAGAGQTAGALLTAPFGLVDYMDDLTDMAAGRPIVEGSVLTPFEYSQAVTGGISSHLNDKYGTIDKSVPVIGGKGLGDVYGVGTSIAQSAMSAYTLGSLGTMVSYFGQGAAAGVDDALSRGATDEQAMLYGTLVGAAEGISESIGVDNMFKLGSADTLRGFFKNILKQAGSEGVEEGISSVLSEFADRFVMQDKSVYENAVRTYMSQGMSEEEARSQAGKDVVNSIAWDAVAGALSGGVHGGVQTTVQSVKENNQSKNIGATIRGNHNVEDLGKLASDLNNDSYQKYIDLINSGNISDKNLGRLYKQMSEDTASTVTSEENQSVMRAVANMANEMGDSKNSGLIASAIQKKNDGEKLSSEEKAVLKTDTAKAIMAELEKNGLDIKASDSLWNAYDMRDRTESVLLEGKSEKELAIKDRAKELTKGEESAKIEGIRVENGVATLLTAQGEVLADEAQLSSSNAELVANAENMDSEKANLFVSQYDGKTDVNTYSKAFDFVYSCGESQLGVSYAMENIRNLNASQVSAIYKAGRQKKVAERQKAINAIKNKYTAKKFYKGTVNDSAIDYTNSGKGEVNWSDLTESQRENVDFLKALFTGLGINAKFTANGKDYDGYYDPENNEIVIDVYAGTTISNVKDLNLAMITTSAHELTHWMEVASPELFAKIKDHAFETLRLKDGKSDAVRIAEEKFRIESKHPEMKGKVTNEYAISEIVARSCEDMLSMTNVGKEALARLSDSERKTFFGKVKEIIQDMISYIDEILGRYKSRTKEAEILREYQGRLKDMAKMWEEAMNEAIEVNQSIIEGALTDGISKDGTTIVGENMIQMSEKTYNDGGRAYLEKWLKRKSSGKKATISKEDAADILRQTDAIYEIMQDIKANNELPDYARWAETNVTKDENGKTISVIVKNGDYSMNLDTSLVCKKRVALNAVLNALVQSNDLSVYTLTETDVAELNAIIKEHEFEIACALCFVDSKRYRVGSWAESFCEGVHNDKENKYGFNEMVRSLVPKGSNIKIDEFNFTNRDILNQPTENLLKNADDSELDFTLIDQIMRDNPPAANGVKSAQYRYAEAIKNNKELRSILNPSEIISSIGLDAIRVKHTALYGLINGHQGTAKPKFAHQTVAFANDILKATSWNAERAKYVGGVRLQSFSDFMANMVFDYVQMISELAAKKLTAHAYTKEPLFVKLFGMTGIKINMSLVPKVDLTPEQIKRFKGMTDAQKDADPEYQRLKETAGLRINENGEVEYLWEDETFPYDVAMDIMADPRYTKNCGTIAVGISNKHIRKLLADDRISMVIPYHKSGLNHRVAEMRNIALYNDYTSVQNTRYRKTGEKLDTKKDKDFNFYGDLYGDGKNQGTHDPKQTAENYKKWCEENNFLPRFDEFKDDPNYYKLLIDFTVYDINDNMRYTEHEAVKAVYPSEAEFKDLIVNGVQKNGKTYGGLKQAQEVSTRLDNETQQIVNEFRNRLLEKHGEDVLSRKNADKVAIEDGMTDEERFNILKDKSISIIARADAKKMQQAEAKYKISSVHTLKESERKKLFKKLGDEFGVFKGYSNRDVELSFVFSKSGMSESENKQKGNYDLFAKMFSCFDDVIESAIGIEVHNRNSEGYKPDNTLKAMYVLVSAFEDGNNIVPVKLEIKEFTDKNNTLYVAVALESIKKDEVAKEGNTENGVTQASRSSIISLSYLFANINPLDESFLKYVPKQFLEHTLYADKDDNDSRTLLANALETVAQNDDERDLLKEYRSNIDILNIKESELKEIKKQIKELTFGSGEKDAKKLAYLKKRAEKLQGSINYFDKKLLNLEANKHLKDVVEREKEKVRKKRSEYVKEALSSQKERLAKKAEIENITRNALTLKKWLVTNSKDKHVAEVMKPVVKSLFEAIDFSSKQLLNRGVPTKTDISLAQAISDVRDVIVNGGVDELQGFGMDEELEQLVKTANVYARTIGDNAYILNQMTLEELQTLDTFVRAIKKVVSEANNWYVMNSKNGIVYESQRDMKHMKELGQAKTHGNKLVASVLKTLNWDNINPYNAFKRMGEGSKKIFEALQDGWDKFAFNVRKVIEYADETYKPEDVKRWNEEVHEIDILLPASDEERKDPNFKGNHKTIRMTTAQMMSVYCLQKREQALGHMLQGGIGISDIKTKDGVIAQNGTVMLSKSEIKRIVDVLKQDEKAIKVADALQKFMAEDCAEWGNEISMRRFGYKAFGEENYFPIKADPRVLKNKNETQEREKSLYKLLNASFTKALTQNANNRILVEDIFDVFARHTTEMAKYNALALPVLDAVRWFNYTEKGQKMADGQYQTFSIRESMRDAFGDEAINYINTFLEDLNGSSNVGRDSLAKGFFTNAKIASVAMNLKVAALQPTSYLRAGAVMNPKYLTKPSSPSEVKEGIELAKKWCGMAYWKSLGFYDTNIQRGLSEIIKNDKSFKDKVTEKSMKLAEKMDEFTWGCLWNACEAEIRDTRKDLKVGDDAYYEAVGKRLRDVIYQTQVVDSTITRSQMMRSPDKFDKVLTMFGSEPTLSYNMLADVFWDWKLDERKYGKTKAFENNRKKMVRVAVAYTMTNLMTAILETAFEAYRDDDDDEEEFIDYINSFIQTFLSNQGITTKIPYVKDLISILQGFTSSRTDTQWIQNLTYAFKDWVKIFNGEGNVYKAVYRTLNAASQVSGYSFSNAMRELVSFWNATIGNIFPSLKLTK